MLPWGGHWQGARLSPGARVWVLGATGQVGQACLHVLTRWFDVRGFTHAEWDITLPESVQRWLLGTAPRERPRCIINCAALTNVDQCEDMPDRAMVVNAHGPGLLAHACERMGLLLVHLSTDYVFDGTQGIPYEEADPPRPLSAYGRSKLDGERRVAERMPSGQFLILRTSWVFSSYRPNFVTWVLERARAGLPVRAVTDQVSAPTWADDLAEAIGHLLLNGVRGWVHFRNEGVCSRYEQAEWILRTQGLPTSLLEARTMAEMGWRARRPAYSVLSTARYQARTGLTPRDWRTILPRG
jgi:dTDP-4-dehydrorhamnose reductase